MNPSMNKKCVVLTTVNAPTEAVHAFIATDYDVIVVGDRKTPDHYRALDCVFLDLSDQRAQFPAFGQCLPLDSYARKNLGYLYAIRHGYEVIAESDDDNLPKENWGKLPHRPRQQWRTVVAPAYPNIYSLYTSQHVWPRGFPLDKINASDAIRIEEQDGDAFIVQGLADDDPDVDAIHRLVFGGGGITFGDGDYLLASKVMSAFNAQNTFWLNRASFPYLYLPATVPFRCCDILRAYIAQYGIWARGGQLAFTSASVRQDRNPHDLLEDFRSEMPLYLDFHKIMAALDSVDLSGVDADLLEMYRALHRGGLIESGELSLVEAWLEQVEAAGRDAPA